MLFLLESLRPQVDEEQLQGLAKGSEEEALHQELLLLRQQLLLDETKRDVPAGTSSTFKGSNALKESSRELSIHGALSLATRFQSQ